MTSKSIGIGVMMLVSIAIIITVHLTWDIKQNDDKTIFNTSPQMDTVEVIIEYDGEREIRWYTLDTIRYE